MRKFRLYWMGFSYVGIHSHIHSLSFFFLKDVYHHFHLYLRLLTDFEVIWIYLSNSLKIESFFASFSFSLLLLPLSFSLYISSLLRFLVDHICDVWEVERMIDVDADLNMWQFCDLTTMISDVRWIGMHKSVLVKRDACFPQSNFYWSSII